MRLPGWMASPSQCYFNYVGYKEQSTAEDICIQMPCEIWLLFGMVFKSPVRNSPLFGCYKTDDAWIEELALLESVSVIHLQISHKSGLIHFQTNTPDVHGWRGKEGVISEGQTEPTSQEHHHCMTLFIGTEPKPRTSKCKKKKTCVYKPF